MFKRASLIIGGLLALMLTATSAQAVTSGSVSTGLTAGNSNAGIMFDIVAKAEDLMITGFDLNLASTGTKTISLYTRNTMATASSGSSSGWTLVASSQVSSSGSGNATFWDIPDFALNAGETKGLYILITDPPVNSGGRIHFYDTGAPGLVQAQDAQLQVLTGYGSGGGFSYYSGRSFSGAVRYNYNLDSIPPGVEIMDAPAEVTDLSPFTITIQFSEDVTGFTLADLQVSGGTAGNFVTVDANTYTADITPDGSGDVTIDVPENVAEDGAGNDNTAAPQVVVTAVNVVDRTREVIANFMITRADRIAGSGPDLKQRLRGQASPSGKALNLKASGTAEAYNLEFATGLKQVLANRQNAKLKDMQKLGLDPVSFGVASGTNNAGMMPYDVWFSGSYTRVDTGSRDSDIWLLYGGVDYQYSETTLIGAMVQVDIAEEKDSAIGSKAKGTGWMAGPYMVTRLKDDLILNAKALWGRSDNDVSPLGTYTDQFDTKRWLLEAELSDRFEYKGLKIDPAASVVYFHEKQDSYTDSLGFIIPGQTISMGRTIFGPTAYLPVEADDGSVTTWHGAIEGVWDFDRNDTVAAQSLSTGADKFRGKATVGVGFMSGENIKINLEGFYDGIGRNNYDASGAQVDITIPLN